VINCDHTSNGGFFSTARFASKGPKRKLVLTNWIGAMDIVLVMRDGSSHTEPGGSSSILELARKGGVTTQAKTESGRMEFEEWRHSARSRYGQEISAQSKPIDDEPAVSW
jgi:hypothetical protein